VLWSVAGLVLEIPSGAWADAVSRRWLIAVASMLRASGFAVWTVTLLTGVAPYAAFALGFLLWGACTALKSGSVEALVYDELAAVGASGSYLRTVGRGEAVSMLVATALAAPAYRLGGFALVGAASVAMSLVNAGVALTLPERPRTAPAGRAAYLGELRTGLREARRHRALRRLLVVVAAISTLGALDEYVPLWLSSIGVAPVVVPLLLVPPMLAMAVAGWWAGSRRLPPPGVLVGVGIAALVAGAASRQPAGIAGIALALALWTAARLKAEATLQRSIEVTARATVLSVAGLGTELGRIALHAAVVLVTSMR
jgi:hypothetical protein